jgi:hypothetical protein
MKQERGIEGDWKDDSDTPRRRWARRLRWLGGLFFAAVLAYLTGIARSWPTMLALLMALVAAVMLGSLWLARRGQRRWRRDSALVVPSLPSPVSRIPVERQWLWTSSSLVRAPLAIALIAALYWAIVLNELQLPAHHLFAVALLAFVNLWCWHEPLLLVLIVIPGVTVLALLGWLVDTFSLAGAVGVLIGLSVVVAVMVVEIRKRLNRNHPWQ